MPFCRLSAWMYTSGSSSSAPISSFTLKLLCSISLAYSTPARARYCAFSRLR